MEENKISVEHKKLLWVGEDYRNKTGYGRIAKELLPMLRDKYEIICCAISYRGESNEFRMIPANDGTSFGFNKLPSIMDELQPDITILMNDHKIIVGWLNSIKNNCKFHHKSIIPYVCTEYIGLTDNDISIFNEVSTSLLTFAYFTKEEFENRGYVRPINRLGHGYGNTIQKIPKNDAKQFLGIDPNNFIFFSGSKNQPRKRLDILIRAFVEFVKDKQEDKVMLMMNCGLVDSGWDIVELYKRLCRENDITNPDRFLHLCSKNMGDADKNDEELSIIYNACDVGVTTSTGEAFGLVPFEQSSLGIPQIIPNWGGIIESCQQGCIKIDTNDFYVYPIVIQSANGEARTVHYKDVAKAMNTYYHDKELYKRDCELVKKNILNQSWNDIGRNLSELIDIEQYNNINLFDNKEINDLLNLHLISLEEIILDIQKNKNTFEDLMNLNAVAQDIFYQNRNSDRFRIYKPYLQKCRTIINLIQKKKPKNILIISTDIGHSALLMLLSDPCVNVSVLHSGNGTEKSFEYLKKIFKKRIDILAGDSSKILPNLLRNTKINYDLFFVDDMNDELASSNIKNILVHGKKGTDLLINNFHVPNIRKYVIKNKNSINMSLNNKSFLDNYNRTKIIEDLRKNKIGLGTAFLKTDQNKMVEIVYESIRNGYRLFDFADIYKSRGIHDIFKKIINNEFSNEIFFVIAKGDGSKKSIEKYIHDFKHPNIRLIYSVHHCEF